MSAKHYCAVLAAMLMGCANSTPRQEDLATTHLSVVSVVPWDEIKDKLSPNFKTLKGDEALADVLPVTQVGSDRSADVLKIQAQGAVGLQGQAVPKATTPSLPSELLKSDLAAKFAEKIGAMSLQSDPILARQLATALVQETAMLNTYIENAALRKDYVPYVVRLQVSVIPSRRPRAPATRRTRRTPRPARRLSSSSRAGTWTCRSRTCHPPGASR